MSRISLSSLVANTGAPFPIRDAIERFREEEDRPTSRIIGDCAASFPTKEDIGQMIGLDALPVRLRVTKERAYPVLKAFMAYQFPALIERMVDKFGWSERVAKQAFEDTKKFLYLCCSDQKGPFVPTLQVDEVWHNFILFTEEYGNFCRQYCGRFIHHHPTRRGEKSDGVNYALKTRQAVNKVFGKQLTGSWKAAEGSDCRSSDCNGDRDGGSCRTSWPCLFR